MINQRDRRITLLSVTDTVSQRHNVINHRDRRITLLGDTHTVQSET